MKTPATQLVACCATAWVLMASSSSGQVAVPPAGGTAATSVRLAIVTEETSAAPAADLLTAELSQAPEVQLLERAEIDRVYREQSLSAAGKDYLKLGQLLGADGLLILSTLKEDTNQFLQTRLVAVKQGVVVESVRSAWPVTEAGQWAGWLGRHLRPAMSKLSVRAGEAVPVSIVNLRSAVRSAEAQEPERQLTLLLIERLSRQREVFVLERQRMGALVREKDLGGMDETAFWNGGYLLEGVLDRDGYSKEKLTVHARLTPPAGGQPIEIPLSGNRTNLAEISSALAEKVVEALKLKSRPGATWKPAEEAAQFLTEANWALKWQIIPQAQAAADSAWALGRRDLDCAMARVRAYLPDIQMRSPYGEGNLYTYRDTNSILAEVKQPGRLGLVWQIQAVGKSKMVHYVWAGALPEPELLHRARHILTLYGDFTRNLPADEPRIGSAWHWLGLDALTAVSQVLEYYHFLPEAQVPVADQLSELRALCREMGTWLARSPSVRDSYWVGDRIVTHDELYHTIWESPNIFRCKLDYGAFWQETPENCAGLYRDLLASPVYCYLNEGLLLRELYRPRLTGWTAEARLRCPMVWTNFVQELKASTNVLWQIEARFLELADAQNESQLGPALEALGGLIVTNRQSHTGMLTPGLIGQYGQGVSSEAKDQAQQRFQTEYWPKIKAMDADYWNYISKLKQERAGAVEFEKQKQYLTSNTPYDFFKFTDTFRFSQYSKAQAAELQPLLAGYKSNLTAQAAGKTGLAHAQAQNAITQVGFAEQRVSRVLTPPPPPAPKPSSPQPAPPAVAPKPLPDLPPRQPQTPPSVLTIYDFHPLPQDRLEGETIRNLRAFALRVRQGKLWLDLRYDESNMQTTNSAVQGTRFRFMAAAAAWDPAANSWDILTYPGHEDSFSRVPVMDQQQTGLHFDIFGAAFYLSDWDQIQKFDLKTRRWDSLAFPGQKLADLFVVNGCLFAVNDENIIELRDGGQSTSVLASRRRRPAASLLDFLDSFGQVALFPGPGDALRACIGGKVYTWDGHDWSETQTFGPSASSEVLDEVLLVRSTPWRQPARLWRLPFGESRAEFYWQEPWWEPNAPPQFGSYQAATNKSPAEPTPSWTNIPGLHLAKAPAVASLRGLWFYVERCDPTNVSGRWTAPERDGRHGDLVCLEPGSPRPLTVRLRFDCSKGSVPSQQVSWKRGGEFSWDDVVWMRSLGDRLLLGQLSLAGVWSVPQAEVLQALDAERARLRSLEASQIAAARERRQALLAKYDLNKNGTFDPEEKAAALDDSLFLTSELDAIDKNGNGRLDPAEFKYFDPEKKGVLTPKAVAGIELTMRLLAQTLLEKFDDDRDGQLDAWEFTELLAGHNDVPFSPPADFVSVDKDHNGKVSLDELQAFFERQTRALLVRAGRGPMFAPVGSISQRPLKDLVETYWATAPPDVGGPRRTPRPGPASKSPEPTR